MDRGGCKGRRRRPSGLLLRPKSNLFEFVKQSCYTYEQKYLAVSGLVPTRLISTDQFLPKNISGV